MSEENFVTSIDVFFLLVAEYKNVHREALGQLSMHRGFFIVA